MICPRKQTNFILIEYQSVVLNISLLNLLASHSVESREPIIYASLCTSFLVYILDPSIIFVARGNNMNSNRGYPKFVCTGRWFVCFKLLLFTRHAYLYFPFAFIFELLLLKLTRKACMQFGLAVQFFFLKKCRFNLLRFYIFFSFITCWVLKEGICCWAWVWAFWMLPLPKQPVAVSRSIVDRSLFPLLS